MKIESPAFQHEKTIPQKFTCQGEGISPELLFQDIPQEAKSLVLIVDDPDAPSGTFDHWIVWNIPPKTQGLAEGASPLNQGKNSYGNLGYKGPCPPPGNPHRYFFKLYALDVILLVSDEATKKEVESAIEGHILEKSELMGTYQRH